jgi:predicted transcriptional regulator
MYLGQMMTKAPIVYGSRRHDALVALRVLRKPSTCIEIKQLFPKIGTNDQLTHALRDLVVKSLVIKVDENHYQITNYGVNALKVVAKDTASRPHKD